MGGGTICTSLTPQNLWEGADKDSGNEKAAVQLQAGAERSCTVPHGTGVAVIRDSGVALGPCCDGGWPP